MLPESVPWRTSVLKLGGNDDFSVSRGLESVNSGLPFLLQGQETLLFFWSDICRKHIWVFCNTLLISKDTAPCRYLDLRFEVFSGAACTLCTLHPGYCNLNLVQCELPMAIEYCVVCTKEVFEAIHSMLSDLAFCFAFFFVDDCFLAVLSSALLALVRLGAIFSFARFSVTWAADCTPLPAYSKSWLPARRISHSVWWEYKLSLCLPVLTLGTTLIFVSSCEGHVYLFKI